jgi:hypothetical protein
MIRPLGSRSPGPYRARMASWDDVRRTALALPGAVEETGRDGLVTWRVRGRAFARERPLRTGDLAELGDAAPAGPVPAVQVPDLAAKEAVLAGDPAVCFTTGHFTGWPVVLVRLDDVPVDLLAELVSEAWACRAAARLVARHRPV